MGSGVSTVVKDIGLRVVVKMVGLEVCSVGLRVSMFPVMGFLVGDEVGSKVPIGGNVSAKVGARVFGGAVTGGEVSGGRVSIVGSLVG